MLIYKETSRNGDGCCCSLAQMGRTSSRSSLVPIVHRREYPVLVLYHLALFLAPSEPPFLQSVLHQCFYALLILPSPPLWLTFSALSLPAPIFLMGNSSELHSIYFCCVFFCTSSTNTHLLPSRAGSSGCVTVVSWVALACTLVHVQS